MPGVYSVLVSQKWVARLASNQWQYYKQLLNISKPKYDINQNCDILHSLNNWICTKVDSSDALFLKIVTYFTAWTIEYVPKWILQIHFFWKLKHASQLKHVPFKVSNQKNKPPKWILLMYFSSSFFKWILISLIWVQIKDLYRTYTIWWGWSSL